MHRRQSSTVSPLHAGRDGVTYPARRGRFSCLLCTVSCLLSLDCALLVELGDLVGGVLKLLEDLVGVLAALRRC